MTIVEEKDFVPRPEAESQEPAEGTNAANDANEANETSQTGKTENAEPEAAGEEAAPDVNALQEEINRLKEQVAAYYDQYLRSLAEADNIRKRAQREREEYMKFAAVPLIKKLLPVMDDLERALTMSESSRDFDALYKGLQMISKRMQEIIESEGVQVIEALGKPFDPQYHQPLMVESSPDHPENTVIEELQKGYMIHGRVIRPSLVKVSN
ncbi:MAG TPA: nucleotide exchange factor GrpE [Syntrophomonadaceae bacterium]|nr:nucleotide exchange factor GrpE [Syntrophomonadaceae bacterium]HOQ10099.1 nucleotide exchange factor GrpE [Syntrophomonadaceae bacterium]HPU49202.1 nucleotide exchange factor GrpE [Syntrophomonadaceae bacterium]